MSLISAQPGSIIASALFNNSTINLFHGVAGFEDYIQLGNWIPGTFVLQPNQALSSGADTRLFQIKQSGGTEQFAITATGGIIANANSTFSDVFVRGTLTAGAIGATGSLGAPNLGVSSQATIQVLSVGGSASVGGSLTVASMGTFQAITTSGLFSNTSATFNAGLWARNNVTIDGGFSLRASPTVGAVQTLIAGNTNNSVSVGVGSNGLNFLVAVTNATVASLDSSGLFTAGNVTVPSQATIFALSTPSGGSASIAGPLAVASQSNLQGVTILRSTLIPSAGGGILALGIGSNSTFGIFAGANATPNVAAVQGSLYISSGGTSGARMWIATNSAGSWTPVTATA